MKNILIIIAILPLFCIAQKSAGTIGVGVDASVTNEGQLQVGAGGANSATIISNTSGSGTPTIAGGTGISVTETTGLGLSR